MRKIILILSIVAPLGAVSQTSLLYPISLFILDNKSITVYDTTATDGKIVAKVSNYSEYELWWGITIRKKENGFYFVEMEFEGVKGQYVAGWIQLENTGVWLTCHSDKKIHLYEMPNVSSEFVTISMDDIEGEYKVYDVDVSNGFVQIKWNDGKYYWVSQINQCTNPFTTCTGN